MRKDLVEKYNQAAPRYTSYPPANHFRDDVGEQDYLDAVARSNKEGHPNISLYFHIPFCDKKCHYCGCNTVAMQKANKVESYISAIVKELKMLSKLLDQGREVSQVHFGGGTPNSLSTEQLGRIIDTVKKHFHFMPGAEMAIECNPAGLDNNYIDRLNAMGFNRFSLGIQDFNPAVLKAVNRDPSKLPVGQLMAYIRNSNAAARINLDFIYGLPYQEPEGFFATIEHAIALRPDRLVTFSYAHLPNLFKGQRVLERIGLPAPDERWLMFTGAWKRLKAAGYVAIGLDHYALENDELSLALEDHQLHRNFQGYCTRATTGQVYALGVTGISQLDSIYTQHTRSIEKYIESINRGHFPVEKGYRLDIRERIIRDSITELMCNKRIIFSELADRYRLSPEDIRNCLVLDPKTLNAFAADKILTWNEQGVRLHSEGLLFIRNVAASLDPLMKRSTKKYSSTI